MIIEALALLFVLAVVVLTYYLTKLMKRPRPSAQSETTNRELDRESKEDSELDGLMSEGDIFFPEEQDEDE